MLKVTSFPRTPLLHLLKQNYQRTGHHLILELNMKLPTCFSHRHKSQIPTLINFLTCGRRMYSHMPGLHLSLTIMTCIMSLTVSQKATHHGIPLLFHTTVCFQKSTYLAGWQKNTRFGIEIPDKSFTNFYQTQSSTDILIMHHIDNLKMINVVGQISCQEIGHQSKRYVKYVILAY